MLNRIMGYANEHPVLKPFMVILPIGLGILFLYNIGYVIGKLIYYILNT